MTNTFRTFSWGLGVLLTLCAALCGCTNPLQNAVQLGDAAMRDDRYAEGEAFFRQALELAPSNTSRETRISLYWRLGVACGYQGKHEDAEKAYEKALDLVLDGGLEESAWAAETYVGLGNARFVQEDFEGALTHGRKALALFEKLGADSNGPVLKALTIVATGLMKQGKQAEADSHFARAAALIDEDESLDDELRLRCMHDIGASYLHAGKLQEAEPFVDRALGILESGSIPDSTTVADALEAKGYILYNRGLFDEAKPYMERALSILEQQQPDDSPRLAKARFDFACLCKALGEFDKAETQLALALKVFRDLHGENHEVVERIQRSYDSVLNKTEGSG